ncbi:hypothetical protein COD67_19020 [Bacillus cereus]|nr:hypothetical protein COI89_13410 [Bacillus cereus]PGU64234.1 hypothetical protein COD67_19020 [Bacillus cereus]
MTQQVSFTGIVSAETLDPLVEGVSVVEDGQSPTTEEQKDLNSEETPLTGENHESQIEDESSDVEEQQNVNSEEVVGTEEQQSADVQTSGQVQEQSNQSNPKMSRALDIELGTIQELFPDTQFANVIAGKLDIAVTDPVTDTQLASITDIAHDSTGPLSNLEGAQYLTGLKRLSLYNKQVSDLSPLATLTQLTTLALNYNQVEDLTPLAGLTNLQILHLGANSYIHDLTPLENLTHLKTLLLAQNDIEDITPLSNLTNLDYLVMNYNNISDLTPLEGLTNLTTLELSFNLISDVSPLENLTNLTRLWLEEDHISDLRPLASMDKLTDYTFQNQTIQLDDGIAGVPTEFKLYNIDGSVPQTIDFTNGTGTLSPDSITWDEIMVDNSLTWIGSQSFSGVLKQTTTDGDIQLLAPDFISFGTGLKVSPKDERYKIASMDNGLTVQDTRYVKQSWILTATLSKPLTHTDGSVLPNALVYHSNNQDDVLQTNASTLIYENQNNDNNPFSISDKWSGVDNDGLFLDIKAGQAKVGKYDSIIKWTLEDVPTN